MSDIELQKEEEEDSIDLLELIGVLVKNKKLIILTTLISAILVVIFSIISLKLPPEISYLPNIYSPKTIVILNSSSGNSGLDSLISSSGMGAIAGLAGVSDSQGNPDSDLAIKLITMNSFLNTVSHIFNLEEVYNTANKDFPKTELRQIINRKLSISVDEKTNILEITYKDIDKILATDIVNKVTELLEEEFTNIDKVRNRNQYSLVEEQKTLVENELRRLQDEVIAFQIKHNIMDVNIVSNELVGQVSQFQSNLLRKEVEIESYGKISSIKDPGYMRLINEKDAILNALKKLENGEVGDYPPVKDLPKLAFELRQLKTDAEIQLVAYKALIQQSETLKLTAEGTGSTFQVLELAEIPEIKSGPSRGILCIIITFLGFMGSIIFVSLRNVWNSIKNDPIKMSKLKGEKL